MSRRRSIRARVEAGDTGILTLGQALALLWWQAVMPWGQT